MNDKERINRIENEIKNITKRNLKVESDKAWEISPVRRLLVTILTYFVIVIYMYSVNIPSPWLNAIVPSAAYLVSTLTMPVFKKWWLKKKILDNSSSIK